MKANKNEKFYIDPRAANIRSQQSLLREISRGPTQNSFIQMHRDLQTDFSQKLKTLDQPLVDEMKSIEKDIGHNITYLDKVKQDNTKKRLIIGQTSRNNAMKRTATTINIDVKPSEQQQQKLKR